MLECLSNTGIFISVLSDLAEHPASEIICAGVPAGAIESIATSLTYRDIKLHDTLYVLAEDEVDGVIYYCLLDKEWLCQQRR